MTSRYDHTEQYHFLFVSMGIQQWINHHDISTLQFTETFKCRLMHSLFCLSFDVQSVVSALLNEEDISTALYAGRFIILLLGWLGYWYVMAWYIKFVWTSSKEVESREIQATRETSPRSVGSESSAGAGGS